MKKILHYSFLSLFLLFFIVLALIVSILFFKPNLVLNEKSLKWASEKQTILSNLQFKKLKFKIDWNAWNDRHLYGEIKDLCFSYDSDALSLNTCLEELTWDFRIVFDLTGGFKAVDLNPVKLISNELVITPKKSHEEKVDSDFSTIDLYSYYEKVWNPLIPSLEIDFKKIVIELEKNFVFDLGLNKSKDKLSLTALGFSLIADPKEFNLSFPKNYKLPVDPVLSHKLYLNDFEVRGKISQEKLEIESTGKVESILVNFKTFIDLPIVDDPMKEKFRKTIISHSEARVTLENINQTFKKYTPEKYSLLPAPLNIMEGNLKIEISGEKSQALEFALLKIKTRSQLKSHDQALIMRIDAAIPFNVLDFSLKEIGIEIAFDRVNLKLPRLSKTSLPPQFIPDTRITNTPLATPFEKLSESKKTPLDLNLDLEALGKKALHLSTNLLDEDLRLNFSLKIRKGELQDGFIKILPLKTSVFKRPINLEFLKVSFNPPYEPIVESKVIFPLPIYKITLDLEGPISNPRYAFSSEPALPQSDIFAVLLFGRPISELSPDDKSQAQKTNQILSGGIFSLAVLYYLAGSPVEYIGYDSESNNATASFGLNSKTSLRVEGSGEGVNSTGVRRSLGKGWYIDTSVEKSKLNNKDSKSYGVMLERILSY